jgi:PAS domain S-box-containing protein
MTSIAPATRVVLVDKISAQEVAASELAARLAKTEAALAASETRCRALLENGGVGIAQVAPDGRWLEVNERLCALVGYSREELLSLRAQDITHPDDRAEDAEAVRRVLAGEEATCQRKKRYIHKSGLVRWVSVTSSPTRSPEGVPVVFTAVIVDISRDMEAEEATRAALAAGEHLRLALAASRMGTWQTDYVRHERRHSLETSEILGLEPSAPLLWKDHLRNVLPEDRAAVVEAQARMRAGHDDASVEYRIRRPDGQVRWLDVHGRVVERQADGAPARALGVIADITERKEAEDRLWRREERYRMAFEAGKVGVFDLDFETGLMSWDERSRAALDLAPGEALEYDRILDLTHPDDRESVLAAVAGARDPAEPAPFLHEWRLLRPDGSLRWVEVQAQAVFCGEGHHRKACRLVGTVRGITRRKVAELALAESEARFRSTFENAAVGIVHVAPDGSLLRANSRFCEIVGWPPEELSARTFQNITFPDDLEANLVLLKRVLAGEINQYAMEKRYLRKDGTVIWANLTVGCVRKRDGAIDYLISVIEDVTKRKQAEEYNRLLLHEVSHRAKNLLAVAQAVARQTAGDAHPKEFARLFSARLAGLAASQDLVIESDWRGVDIGELVRSQLAGFAGLIGRRITVSGPPLKLSPAAAQTIGMALHELATNASKYGALSNADGTVEATWEVVALGRAQRFRMNWSECGGPPVTEPARRGFGHKVTVQMVEHALDAEVMLEHLPRGIVWHLSAPAETVLDAARPLESGTRAVAL